VRAVPEVRPVALEHRLLQLPAVGQDEEGLLAERRGDPGAQVRRRLVGDGDHRYAVAAPLQGQPALREQVADVEPRDVRRVRRPGR
jgi:hypothetical protein